jgi:hypothetical protein
MKVPWVTNRSHEQPLVLAAWLLSRTAYPLLCSGIMRAGQLTGARLTQWRTA